MGMSSHVIGFRPPDEKWQKMKAVWDASKAAGIEPPSEVVEFFNWSDPDPNGVEVELPLRGWRDDSREGFEIDVASIPPNVTVIRFYNSW